MFWREKLKRPWHWLVALAAYWFYGRPSRKLIVVGVTGTKGKSTTARLAASVLEANGDKVGLMTTVEFQIGSKKWPNNKKMTMLGRGQIQKMLRRMVRAGCKYVVVETSSEGILQYRHLGLNYDLTIFTNLGKEHAERHGGFLNLKKDKGKIFARLGRSHKKRINGAKVNSAIIANSDDENSNYYLSFKADKKITFGFGEPTTKNKIQHVKATSVTKSGQSHNFTVNNQDYRLNLAGEFNIYNALAAIALGICQGIAPTNISKAIDQVKLVPGRMEFIPSDKDFKVVVDYAHEPMSLAALFKSLKQLAKEKKIIGVIGSDGGGRDTNKRPLMGKIAAELTDYIVITDVNPFDEDPQKIAQMLEAGAKEAGKKEGINLFIEIDRRKAIAKAFSLAKTGDIVAITAKGTEPCIVVADGKKIPWNERRVVKELLQAL